VGTLDFDTRAQQAWSQYGFGSPTVIIGIVDSGIDVDEVVELNITPGWNFADGNGDTDDFLGHGTRCAVVAAGIANNGVAGCGAAPGCLVMPLKVLSDESDPEDAWCYLDDVAAAVCYGADHGVDVLCINTCFPMVPGSGEMLDDAIMYAHNAGVTIVAGTGNKNGDAIGYPSSHAMVIGVGAATPCGERKRSGFDPEWAECIIGDPNGTSCDGEVGWGSNYGVDVVDAANAVDVIAPSLVPAWIWRTDDEPFGFYPEDQFFTGTCPSAAYVAGVCAMVKSVCPTCTPEQVRDRVVLAARDVVNVESGVGWDRYSGYGMVDVEAACRMADVWLDYSHDDGTYLGSFRHPCGSFAQALSNVPVGGILAIKPGQSHEPLTWPCTITRPMTIIGPMGASVTGH
jgi:subtilisin family serine protease